MKYVFIHPFGFDFHFLANIAVQLLKTHCQMISNIVLLFLFFFFILEGKQVPVLLSILMKREFINLNLASGLYLIVVIGFFVLVWPEKYPMWFLK